MQAAGGRLDQAQQQAPGRGLAAAAFADQAEGFAPADHETDVVDRLEDERVARRIAALDGKVFLQALGAQQNAVGLGAGRAAAASVGLVLIACSGGIGPIGLTPTIITELKWMKNPFALDWFRDRPAAGARAGTEGQRP